MVNTGLEEVRELRYAQDFNIRWAGVVVVVLLYLDLVLGR